MPLEVAYYSDALTSGRYGLGRYAGELFHALDKAAPAIRVRPISAHLTATGLPPALANKGYVRMPYSRRITAGLWSTLGKPEIEWWAPWADVVHAVELDYRIATRKPWIVTIHDIGPLTHPQFFRNSHPWLLKAALKAAVQRAAAIVCVSSATANEVENYVRCSLGDRLHIIPEGVSEEFFQNRRDPCQALHLSTTSTLHHSFPHSTPYFLWTGSLNPRKNLLRVVAAFEKIADQIPHHLVLSGGLGWDSQETLRRIQTSPVASRIHLPGHVNDKELRGLYQGATALVYVSLMEGFGLPILEAMACGCPVVTSNCSSMPEVAGDAAFLVDPLNSEEIGHAMHCLATDLTFAKHLAARGRARAEDFHWESCALAMAEIYTAVARKPYRKHLRSLASVPRPQETCFDIDELSLKKSCTEGASTKD